MSFFIYNFFSFSSSSSGPPPPLPTAKLVTHTDTCMQTHMRMDTIFHMHTCTFMHPHKQKCILYGSHKTYMMHRNLFMTSFQVMEQFERTFTCVSERFFVPCLWSLCAVNYFFFCCCFVLYRCHISLPLLYICITNSWCEVCPHRPKKRILFYFVKGMNSLTCH